MHLIKTIAIILLLVGLVIAASAGVLIGQYLRQQTLAVTNGIVPAQRYLGELEATLWSSLHAVVSHAATNDPRYEELYRERIAHHRETLNKLESVIATNLETNAFQEYQDQSDIVVSNTDELIILTNELHTQLAGFQQAIYDLDAFFDFELQGALNSSTAQFITKEQLLREVEVSLQALRAHVNHYIAIAPGTDGTKPTKSEAIEDQLEKDIALINEHWSNYKSLSLNDSESTTTLQFDGRWPSVPTKARELMNARDKQLSQLLAAFEAVATADDILDHQLEAALDQRLTEVMRFNVQKLIPFR